MGMSHEKVRRMLRDAGNYVSRPINITREELQALYVSSKSVKGVASTLGVGSPRAYRLLLDYLGIPKAEAAEHFSTNKGTSPRAIIGKLQTMAAALGRTPTHNDIRGRGAEFGLNTATIYRKFHSLRKAAQAAGLEPNKIGRRSNGRT